MKILLLNLRLWMLERDESDAFITDIVEEVYKLADKIIYEEYLERQSIPYTVTQLKDEFLQILEVKFVLGYLTFCS